MAYRDYNASSGPEANPVSTRQVEPSKPVTGFFKLKFTNFKEKGASYDPKVFWEHFLSLRGSEAAPISTVTAEAMVKANFGIALRQQFVGSATVPFFGFKVFEIEYSTMILSMSVSGLRELAKWCSEDLPLLEILLAQYAPLALASLFEIPENKLFSNVGCEVDSTTLASGFEEYGAVRDPSLRSEPQQAPPRKLDSLRWAWIASNTSLLVPVAATLFILMIAFQSLREERQDILKAHETLQQNQAALIQLLVAERQASSSPKTVQSKPNEPQR